MGDDSTIVFTDINKALSASEEEAKNQPACLVAIGGDINGTIFDLLPGKYSIGRSPDNTIPLEFQGISRKHMEVTVTELEDGDVQATVQDAGSRNGTYLNNQKLAGQATLRKGDVLKMGSVALRFIPKGDPERLTYDKLSHEANTDGLTNCFNKTYFNQACDLEVRKSKITGNPISLILFDLDHFKKLNDNYGHDAGDFVLKEMADIIRKNGVREGDVFARYGGEEFVILLPNTPLKNGFEIAERVRRLVEAHKFMYSDQRLPVTASIGVADYRKGVDNGTDLFKRADNAVYKSKEGGRNRVSYFKPE